ncbi:MAG: polyprenyl synthetase family protein [Lachnospiraceae bacterium]|nr:polyprenyl synthetase family protein [Lachnospiraceae bacterium]MDD5852576.1 polyprenyl synthetase family protein [Lachnospiraceae bacterium]
MNFKEELTNRVQQIEDVIFSMLPKEEGPQKQVIEAMRYSVMAGGKRLRPMLMWESYRSFGKDDEKVYPFMAALEYIHNYSLVHDDLPAMDNDEYRRGRKTTHVVYGEDVAILAGDALLNYAYETIAKAMQDTSVDSGMIKAFGIFARKAGIFGMVGGQSVDVVNENNNTDMGLSDILFIHENKTAALIECALMCGAALAGANDDQIAMMEKVGSNIGLAFQIQDDILDATGSFEELGKPIGSDEKNQKATYLSLEGMDKSKEDVEKLSEEAVDILKNVPKRNEFLEELVMSLVTRRS